MMSTDSRTALLEALDHFCTFHAAVTCPTCQLCQCLALTGHLNWAFNVYPHLRPGLASLYAKMGGPYVPYKAIHINTLILRDLLWLANCIRASDGVFLLKSIAWTEHESDLHIFTDASLDGFAFWCVQLSSGHTAPVIPKRFDEPIFFHEAFAVVCAIHWASSLGVRGLRRLLIRTDSMNTVDMFNTLRGRGLYNELLKFAVDILMAHNLDLRVLHIEGTANVVADLLLHNRMDEARVVNPQLAIHYYQPPPQLVAAVAP